jgi:hypothetical protein
MSNVTEKKTKKSSVSLALGSMIIGIAAVPLTAFFSTVLGLAMFSLSVLMIYQAS